MRGEVALAVRGLLLRKYGKASNESILKMKDNWTESWKKYDQNVAEVKKMITEDDPVGLALLSKVEASGNDARQLTAKAIEMALAGKVDEASAFMFSSAYPSVQLWIKDNQEFIKHNEERTALPLQRSK